MAFSDVMRNIEGLVKRANDGKQHTKGPTPRSKVNQRGGGHNSENVIMWHACKFLKCFEMKAKSINDLMSKYLQSRRVSRRGKKGLEGVIPFGKSFIRPRGALTGVTAASK